MLNANAYKHAKLSIYIQGGPKKPGPLCIFPNIYKTTKVNYKIFCTHQGWCMLDMSIIWEFAHFITQSGATW